MIHLTVVSYLGFVVDTIGAPNKILVDAPIEVLKDCSTMAIVGIVSPDSDCIPTPIVIGLDIIDQIELRWNYMLIGMDVIDQIELRWNYMPEMLKPSHHYLPPFVL